MQDNGFANNGLQGGGYGQPRGYMSPSAREISEYYGRDIAVVGKRAKRIDGNTDELEGKLPGKFVNVLHDIFLAKAKSGDLVSKVFK
ncbi:MAG: hypothetical protein KKB81_06530 [Candidatus Margulisbacteria bacterium]|nr:hypothetical protein [Candidatus Margulisiibacteriota bacterium]MBU1022452.1 hypothetical protein [Candidatus Margulisiibacteriota bacterium]MBU1728436.1 hypothetical protein [Candidatus Margulisiibacteriota bacterium]MBU1954583.1 hypothetical protein [Candidatus Margulisiibacteriota bacterium]